MNSIKIHSVTDISHEFTFYFDGRFSQQYIIPQGGQDARNWGTLYKIKFENINLLILQSDGTPCPYNEKDIQAVKTFLESGGGVVVLGDYSLYHNESNYHLNDLVNNFDAEFVDSTLSKPLQPTPQLKATRIHFYGGKAIRLTNPEDWQILITDAEGRPAMAQKKVFEGSILIASRGLCGKEPDASDPINEEWWKPMLQSLVKNKRVDTLISPKHFMPENCAQKISIKIQYSDYLEYIADSLFKEYELSYPVIEKIMGVPPQENMLSTLILLPTGSGGFSSGVAIGLGAWWGGYPDERYGMLELIGHEMTHSWVLPFPEPMWNEGIATYVGVLVAKDLGEQEKADAVLARWIGSAQKDDPEMTRFDLTEKNLPHDVMMAKPMWIFEQLRMEIPDILTRYFQIKRKLIISPTFETYTADDAVAVLSKATKRDLFPWFKSLGINVDSSRTILGKE